MKFWDRVDASGDCWVWTGYLDRDGYGLCIVDDQGTRRAHRTAYELLVGPIPTGLHLDHLCRNRACVNPDHLEPVTPAENARRGLKAKATVCINGHELDAQNTYTKPSGQRGCRPCKAEAQRRYRRRVAA